MTATGTRAGCSRRPDAADGRPCAGGLRDARPIGGLIGSGACQAQFPPTVLFSRPGPAGDSGTGLGLVELQPVVILALIAAGVLYARAYRRASLR